MVCSLIITKLDKIWKATSIFLKMEDDLNIFENGRRPQYFWKWKTTSIFLNGRRPQYFLTWKTTSIFLKMEDDLNHFKVRLGKTTSTISEQPKINKNKYNGCGTAPGNLVHI